MYTLYSENYFYFVRFMTTLRYRQAERWRKGKENASYLRMEKANINILLFVFFCRYFYIANRLRSSTREKGKYVHRAFALQCTTSEKYTTKRQNIYEKWYRYRRFLLIWNVKSSGAHETFSIHASALSTLTPFIAFFMKWKKKTVSGACRRCTYGKCTRFSHIQLGEFPF